MKTLILFSVVLGSTLSFAANKDAKPIDNCLSAREYITTVNYFRKNKDFGLNEKEIQKIADKVSTGCSGASQRFIKVIKVLTKLGIDTRSSINNAYSFIDQTDDYTKVFIEVYKHAYDPKYMDLDALTAMKISLELSTQYKGDVKKSLKDYKHLVEFCLENKSMELPTPKCALVASKITKLGENFEKPIAKPFVKLIKFLQDDKKGPKLDRNKSMKIAQEVISHGPYAFENFKQAFIFATSKSGLGKSVNQALPFAKTLAKRTIKDINNLEGVK